MKTFFTLILTLISINAFAAINRFPRMKIVSGAKAQRIYEQLSEGAFSAGAHFWIEPGYAAGGKASEVFTAKNCPGASMKRGMFKPSFFSPYDSGTCRTEKGQYICAIRTSGHTLFDSERKMERSHARQEALNPACKDISTDDYIATADAGIEELCD